MIGRCKIINSKELYAGYVQLGQYDMEIPSMDPKKKCIIIKNREILNTADSVHVLLYAYETDEFILIQEFRVGIFLNVNQDNPFIFTCISGTIDKGDTPDQTAFREVFEETGIRIKNLQKIAAVYKSPGLTTEKSYLYYSEIETHHPSGIHGVQGEEIKTYTFARQAVYQLMDEMKIIDVSTLLTLNWFRRTRSQL